jgi:hypothetical protein
MLIQIVDQRENLAVSKPSTVIYRHIVKDQQRRLAATT